jgi:hypothetical protein
MRCNAIPSIQSYQDRTVVIPALPFSVDRLVQ